MLGSLVMPPETEEIEQLVNNPPKEEVEEVKPKRSRYPKDYLIQFAKGYFDFYFISSLFYS